MSFLSHIVPVLLRMIYGVAERRDESSRRIYPADEKFSEALEDKGLGNGQKGVFKRRSATRCAAGGYRGLKATATFGQSLCDLRGAVERGLQSAFVFTSQLNKHYSSAVLGLKRTKVRAPFSASKSFHIFLAFVSFVSSSFAFTLKEDGYHVFPGDNIQEALDSAAANPTNKVIKVHTGEYRPRAKRQALVWFNKAHDGIHLEAVGSVTLTAANPELTTATAPGFPAVVNHVVYFGDGISSNTIFKGFRVTGGNHFITDKLTKQMEPDTTVPKNLFFFTDGGGIKIFGRSYPKIQNVEIVGNYASPCGAGVSVQHQGYTQGEVIFENCIFSNNRTQVTGAALDLLEGSAAQVINCLFVGNVSNTGEDVVAKKSGEKPFINSGALTTFQNSRALVRNCTFTGNRNGVDDMGGQSSYINCIFYKNTLSGGLVEAERYELDLKRGGTVRGCFINGKILDPLEVVSMKENVLEISDPRFDARFAPAASEFKNAGFRPSAQ